MIYLFVKSRPVFRRSFKTWRAKHKRAALAAFARNLSCPVLGTFATRMCVRDVHARGIRDHSSVLLFWTSSVFSFLF